MNIGRLNAVCACVFLAVVGASAQGDDGELFPNVKAYDEQVPAPVSRPEKALEKESVKRKEAPPPPAVDQKVEPTALVRWSRYREGLLAPLMSAESQERFEKQFAGRLKGDLTLTVPQKAKEADAIWSEAMGAGIPEDLKRVLWLHALGLSIKGEAKLETRADKAREVLPLLTEETLPAAQARADAVTELAYGALAKASDSLLAIVLESQCKLARMQVQGGFPDEAQQSVRVARDAFRFLKVKSDAQRDALAEAVAWTERAAAARAAAGHWQATLATKPGDTFANTQMATLNLSLYGDVGKAAKFAAKSDRKEFQAFAAAARGTSTDEAMTATQALTIAAALLDAADAGMPTTFDKYAVASLVEGKLEEMAGVLEGGDVQRADELKARAAALQAKSGLKRPNFPALALLLQANEPGQTARGTKAAAGGNSASGESEKLVLFVNDTGNKIVRYVKPTAKQNEEALGIVRDHVKAVTEKAGVKMVELETEHCLIETNWEPKEHDFLRKNVEGAYALVAKELQMPVTENIFPGKLPVFVYLKKEDFMKGQDKSASAAATFDTKGGIGFIALYKSSGRFDWQAEWGRQACWCMTTAFLGRYQTNKRLPGWVGMGFAKYVGQMQFTDGLARQAVLGFAQAGTSMDVIFEGKKSSFTTDCVSSSLVEMLIAKDKKAFVDFINKLKDGEDCETALKETYKWGLADVEKTWKMWIARGG